MLMFTYENIFNFRKINSSYIKLWWILIQVLCNFIFFVYQITSYNQWFLWRRRECIYSWSLFILWKKVDPDTNELFVRTEFEFEDDEDMDAFLHKLLYFKEPEWFHDLTHEEIVQLNCVFEQYEPVLGSLIERKTANQ